MPHRFVPKLFTTLRGYTRKQLATDVTAGVIVGIVALPLAIAFAIASGVTPDRGLWTAIVAGFLISVLGGSRVQIGGPTGAFVVIVYGIVQRYGVDGLMVATMMAGVMLIIFGLARLGTVIKFIPQPVVIGFTSGIAVVILSGQLRDLLGLATGALPAGFIERLAALAAAAPTMSLSAVLVSGLTLGIMLVWPRLNRRIPGPFVALVLATAAVRWFQIPVETIGSRFGNLTLGMLAPAIPRVSLDHLRDLVAPAFTIALLGGIESLLSAVVADGMIGGNHRANMELVAQGIANIASPLVGGMPATGAIARTATNVKNGGRTPIAGITHALTLLLITMFFGQWVAWVPLATLAAILVVVSYHMSEWRTFLAELYSPRSDVAVLLATFGLTVLVDLTTAIQVGMVLAALLFVRRMSTVTHVTAVTRELAAGDDGDDDYDLDPFGVRRSEIPAGVEVFEISGPFFFGAAAQFKETFGQIASRPRVLILRMRHVPILDATGLKVLSDVVRQSRREGTIVLLSEVPPEPLAAIRHAVLWREIGPDGVCPSFELAIATARSHLPRTSGATHGPDPLPLVQHPESPGDHRHHG